MIEFYTQIKWVHIAAAVSSGALFLLRGLLVQLGAKGFAMAAAVRYLSYSIDSVLLTAAFMLLTILPGGMFANGWLATKVALVVVYIVLGTFALRRAKTRAVAVSSYVLALLVFGFIVTVARAHHPLGLFHAWVA